MSKIAQYLNEHILGEITGSKAIRERFSRDGSVLTITPELVMFPRVTNDIRKAARFSWQLAEKGHILPLTARGSGSDGTGAAIGKGLIVNTTAHLHNIIHVGLKDKDRFVHVQPGATFKALNDTLAWHGLYVPSYPESSLYGTIGGAVANNTGGQLSGKYGMVGDWVTRLEVVLANGDVIETSRLSKKEFGKKTGLQTFEGEIYRKIDGLIEDNQTLINDSMTDDRDNAGYARLAKVKQRDGSFDLTPLFIGSQGTLGIISEIVLKTDYACKDQSVMLAILDTPEAARDAAAALRSVDAVSLELFDGSLFTQALAKGKKYSVLSGSGKSSIGGVLYVQFNDFNDRVRARKVKKATKLLSQYNASVLTSYDYSFDELTAVREIYATLFASEHDNESMPPLIDGAVVPADRQEEFALAMIELAAKHHVTLPLYMRVLDNTVFARPTLHLDKVGDKQKIFKIINEYSQLVDSLNGTFIAQAGEGRLKANAAYASLDDDVMHVYQQVRAIFDPFGTLNPGVKQTSEIKDLVAMLRSSYDLSDLAPYAPHS